MALKGLRNFQKFDVEGFQKDKVLAFTGIEPQKDKDGNPSGGSKIRVIITADNSDYGAKTEVNRAGNIGQTIVIKSSIPVADYMAQNPQPFATQCRIVNVQKATVYGDFMTELSLTADVKFFQAK